MDTGFFSETSENMKIKTKIKVVYENKIIKSQANFILGDPNCYSEKATLGQVA